MVISPTNTEEVKTRRSSDFIGLTDFGTPRHGHRRFTVAQNRAHGTVDHEAEVVSYIELLRQEAAFNDAQRYVISCQSHPP